MKILSWNVAGLRARLKYIDNYTSNIEKALFNQTNKNEKGYQYFDIVCLQETKCTKDQVQLPHEINIHYPYQYWNSSDGTTQRKGFSGTAIWSKEKPIHIFENVHFDKEGRIITLEFKEFILINVYVPNSQTFENDRYKFREEWDNQFATYINTLQKNKNKELIICGDMNVAHLDIDITNPKNKKNKVPGFFDNERINFAYLIENNSLIDIFRKKNPNKQVSTYWSNFMKSSRRKDNGWRIDYFLISQLYLFQ